MQKITLQTSDETLKSTLNAALKRLGLTQAVSFQVGPENAVVINADQNSESKTVDFFECPVRLGAIIDRIKLYQNRSDKGQQKTLSIGPYILNAYDLNLKDKKGKTATRLTDKERDILVFLHAQNGQECDRSDLLKNVWNYADSVETHTLETHIYRLRQKIEADPADPKLLITTEHGYVLKS